MWDPVSDPDACDVYPMTREAVEAWWADYWAQEDAERAEMEWCSLHADEYP